MKAAITWLSLLLGSILVHGATFNVKDFGAIGDGQVDDTVAIRETIETAGNWAAANEPSIATIYFPEGVYAVAPQASDPEWEKNKPAIFEIPASNVHFVGEGPEKSIISCYTLELKDPETHWTVIGDGFGYFSIKRGAAFSMPRLPANNVRFEGLRITGNTEATGNAWVGGVAYRHGVANGLIKTYKGRSSGDSLSKTPYDNGTLLRFGANVNQPANLVPQAAYYVVNATKEGFQLSALPDGSPLDLEDTVDASGHRFISTNGDGWNMGHSAFDLGGAAFEGFTVENCHLDRWRGEIMHAGGDKVKTIIIRNSLIEHSNASMVSVPSLVMEDSTIAYGYNGIENYARQAHHKAEIRRCRFLATPDRKYGEGNAIAYLGSPETGAVFEDNFFENWSRGILLSEVANNVSILTNQFYDLNQLLTITRLGMYPNDPWSGFDSITFGGNEAYLTRENKDTAIYTQFGGNSNRNFRIVNNKLHISSQGYKYSKFIQDIAGSSSEQRSGYEISGNVFEGSVDFRHSIRPVYVDNENPLKGTKKDIYNWNEGEPEKVVFQDDQFTGRNHSHDKGLIDLTLDPAVQGKYPPGFKVKLLTSSDRKATNAIRYIADPTWNTFTEPVLVTEDQPVWIIAGEDGRFSLMDSPVSEPENNDPPEETPSPEPSPNPNPSDPSPDPGPDPDPDLEPETPEEPLNPEEPVISEEPEAPEAPVIPESPQTPPVPTKILTIVMKNSIYLGWESTVSVDGFEVQLRESAAPYRNLEKYISGENMGIQLHDLPKGVDLQFRIRSRIDDRYSAWVESEVVSFVVVSEVPNQEAAPVPESPPLYTKVSHHWSFEGASNVVARDDVSVKPLSLSLPSGVYSTMGIGDMGTALSFSGTHPGIRIFDSPSINLEMKSVYTIALWIKVEEKDHDQIAIIYEEGGYWRGLNLILERGWLQASGWNRPPEESGWKGTTLNGGKVSPGEWHHIALVLDGTDTVEEDALSLYLDGQLVASGPGSKLWPVGNETGIGQVRGGTCFRGREIHKLNPLQAKLDDLRLYNEALSEMDVQDLILSSFPVASEG